MKPMSSTVPNPFINQTELPWVAVVDVRNGYIQLAPSQEVTRYSELSPELFTVAQAWVAQLQVLGAERVYWISLSEMLPHIHIHLYPRWAADTEKGILLFEQRRTHPQPAWEPRVTEALTAWAEQHQVFLRQP